MWFLVARSRPRGRHVVWHHRSLRRRLELIDFRVVVGSWLTRLIRLPRTVMYETHGSGSGQRLGGGPSQQGYGRRGTDVFPARTPILIPHRATVINPVQPSAPTTERRFMVIDKLGDKHPVSVSGGPRVWRNVAVFSSTSYPRTVPKNPN